MVLLCMCRYDQSWVKFPVSSPVHFQKEYVRRTRKVHDAQKGILWASRQKPQIL